MSYCPVSYGQHTLVEPIPASPSLGKEMARANQLRIALLGYRSHPHVGGQGIYLHYLSKALVDAGHSVDVISGPPYPELDPRVQLIKLPSLDLYAHSHPTRALRPKHLLSWADIYEWWSKLSGAFGEPYCFGRRLVAWFKKHNPDYDIVHDNQSLCYGLLDLQNMGYKVVATVHHPITRDRELALAAATSKGHAWLIKRWYSFLGMQKKVVQQLNHIITVSTQSRQDIAHAFQRAAANIHIIPNGVDTSIFKPQPGVAREAFRLITTASSDQPLKGLSVLLRACALLRNQFPRLRLVVIGKLKPDGTTQQELNELLISDAVDFISGISTEQLVEEYARSSIAVVPSLYEGFGLPAIEAQACGIPLVCSDGGALPEVVGDAALLVQAGNVDALANALADLFSNEARRDELGRRGREHVLQQLTWNCVAQQMVDYYRQIRQEPPQGC